MTDRKITSMAIPDSECVHPECRDVARLLIRDANPPTFPTAVAARMLGIRDKVHPRDLHATVHADRDTAEKFLAANRVHHGLDGWVAPLGVAAVQVVDLRPALVQQGRPITDPDLPDDWTPSL